LDRREELKRYVLAVIELKDKLPPCEGVNLVAACDLPTFNLFSQVCQEVYAEFSAYYPPGVKDGTQEGLNWLQKIWQGK
jgi:hypothetical protein